jgi:hypothetical protein
MSRHAKRGIVLYESDADAEMDDAYQVEVPKSGADGRPTPCADLWLKAV